jgi:hypothetical protein
LSSPVTLDGLCFAGRYDRNAEASNLAPESSYKARSFLNVSPIVAKTGA